MVWPTMLRNGIRLPAALRLACPVPRHQYQDHRKSTVAHQRLRVSYFRLAHFLQRACHPDWSWPTHLWGIGSLHLPPPPGLPGPDRTRVSARQRTDRLQHGHIHQRGCITWNPRLWIPVYLRTGLLFEPFFAPGQYLLAAQRNSRSCVDSIARDLKRAGYALGLALYSAHAQPCPGRKRMLTPAIKDPRMASAIIVCTRRWSDTIPQIMDAVTTPCVTLRPLKSGSVPKNGPSNEKRRKITSITPRK